jgi:hypothetical protein
MSKYCTKLPANASENWKRLITFSPKPTIPPSRIAASSLGGHGRPAKAFCVVMPGPLLLSPWGIAYRKISISFPDKPFGPQNSVECIVLRKCSVEAYNVVILCVTHSTMAVNHARWQRYVRSRRNISTAMGLPHRGSWIPQTDFNLQRSRPG